MDGGGSGAVRGGPGDGCGEGVVDLEGTGTVTEGGELAAVGGGEFGTGDAEELAGGEVGEDEVGFGEGGDFVVGADDAA